MKRLVFTHLGTSSRGFDDGESYPSGTGGLSGNVCGDELV